LRFRYVARAALLLRKKSPVYAGSIFGVKIYIKDLMK
jgi:hypothetical protein